MTSWKKTGLICTIILICALAPVRLKDKYNIFMADTNWELLEKSQTDNETIEEAINRLIEAHDDDANAHIGEGKSLNTHKTQEVVDHPADSIVTDKIEGRSVSPDKRKWDKFVFETYFETIDGWDITVGGLGSVNHYLASVELKTGGQADSYARMLANTFSEGWGVNFSKNPRFMTQIYVKKRDDMKIEILSGDEFCAFGFKVIDDKLYALHRKDVSETPTDYTTEIMTLPVDYTWIKLEAVYTSESKIEFYVDDTLEATHTTNLPEDGDTPEGIPLMEYYILTEDGDDKRIYIRNLDFQQDE